MQPAEEKQIHGAGAFVVTALQRWNLDPVLNDHRTGAVYAARTLRFFSCADCVEQNTLTIAKEVTHLLPSALRLGRLSSRPALERAVQRPNNWLFQEPAQRQRGNRGE